jgi:putative peptidoglycan lipid II flippase
VSTSTDEERSSILGSSAVMAAGTTFSRLSGFIRASLLAAALGNLLHADAFNIANTIPNMLYILLAGGVFNAVLVPQLVRALQHDDDGGEAYTNRIVTLAGLFLAAVTVLLVVAAPLVVGLYTTDWPPEVRESTIDFARYCLPQVFFYGMFVLVGQILNARAPPRASCSSCWCCSRSCAAPASGSCRASTSAAPAWATPCDWAAGRSASWSSTRRRTRS